MTIYKFKNWEQVYNSIGHGAFYHDWLYVGGDWQLHYTSKNPALYCCGKVIAKTLKDINREMKFYGISFVLD